MSEMKRKTPMEHLNIGEFNRGQSSKLIRNLVEKDNAAFIELVFIAKKWYNRRYEKRISSNKLRK